jgi:hypothetical protein
VPWSVRLAMRRISRVAGSSSLAWAGP